MKEIKNKKLTIIILLFITYLSLYFLFHYWSDGIFSRFSSDTGLKVFYRFQDYIPGYLIYGLLSTCLVVEIFYLNKQSKFQYFVIARVGHKDRLKYEIIQVLKTSFFVRLIFNLILLLMIHLFFSNLSFREYSDLSNYVSEVIGLYNNSKISLLLYIIYSSIGFSIFSLFIYSMSYFIKNQYIFKVSGIILFVGMTVIAAILGNQLYVYFDNIKFANPILEAISTVNLVTPAMNNFTTITSLFETHIYFWYSCLCFLIYSVILLYFRYNLEKKNG